MAVRRGPARASLRGLLPRLLLASASGLVTLLLLELAVRIVHPVALHPTDTFLAEDLRSGREGAMRLVPGASARLKRDEFDVAVRINAKGLRDREIAYAKPAGVYRILVLGDSQTFGFGVEAEEAYPKVLERLLGASRRVEVLNAGVPSSGTAHQLQYLVDEGWRYAPDAVVVGYFFNDLRENTQCRLYAVKDGRLVAAARPGSRGMAMHEVVGVRDAKEDVQTMLVPEPVRPPEPSFWVRHSHLVRLLRERLSNLAQARRRTDGTPVTGAELTARLLEEIERQCRERRVRLLIALIPAYHECADAGVRSMRERHAKVLGRLRNADEEILDLLPAIRKAGFRSLYFPVDQHLNPAGHRVAGRELARRFP